MDSVFINNKKELKELLDTLTPSMALEYLEVFKETLVWGIAYQNEYVEVTLHGDTQSFKYVRVRSEPAVENTRNLRNFLVLEGLAIQYQKLFLEESALYGYINLIQLTDEEYRQWREEYTNKLLSS